MDDKELVSTLRNYGYLLVEESLTKHVTFKVGGIAKYFFYPKDIDSLKKTMQLVKKMKLSYFIIGNGSNILPSDDYYNGIIICLSKYFNKIDIQKENIYAESGAFLVNASYSAMLEGLSGLEWANLIPATIGGAIKMNAGSYGKSISDLIESVTFLDEQNQVITLKRQDLEFSYRNSYFSTKNHIILSCSLKMVPKSSVEIEKEMLSLRKYKMSTQPLQYPSCGSIFKNPNSSKAYELIQKCGLKGKIIGGAKISPLHCNFIINFDHSSAEDIKNLIELIKKEVYNNTNTSLEEEVCYFNWR